MSRAYLIYILMFAMLAAGLALIIDLGRAARAPDDLSGDWTVAWENSPPPGSDEPTMRIDQSGRFFTVRFGKRPPISATLRPGWKGARDGPALHMSLSDELWSVNLRGTYPAYESWRIPQVQVELVGPTRHFGVARRVGATAATRPSGVAHAR
jgi:hypothetical protein